jgi:hypothetical protein
MDAHGSRLQRSDSVGRGNSMNRVTSVPFDDHPSIRDLLRQSCVCGLTRRNPQIRAFHQRLLTRHKPKKLALTACMHKMLTILNVMVKRQFRWSASAEALG